MKKNSKISTFQLVLISTGGTIGAGWLFSPFYGFQTAGVWVVASWIITAVITYIIALSFAEVASLLPVVGGVSRFIGVTHNRTMAFIFLGLGWLSYVVYLPLESQSAVQYLGFFWHDLVINKNKVVQLSALGLGLSFFIIIILTWFNCMVLTRVAKANSGVSIWKLLVPFGLAIFLIMAFGKWENVTLNYNAIPISFENILLAVTSSGLAFAFSGFQNGLVLVNSAENPNRAVTASLFAPIILCTVIYATLSLAFIVCIPNPNSIAGVSVAPLFGLVALFSIHAIYVILFIDAVLAPLGTANVFTAVTGRVLYSLGNDFLPNSIITRLNKHSAPVAALWISAAIGMCFLLPFPTWKELVSFLSSVVVFVYLAGPISLIILRKEFPDMPRKYRVGNQIVIGYAGFACCSLLIYWSELKNLELLSCLLIIVVVAYALISKTSNLRNSLKDSSAIIFYMLSLTLISYLRVKQAVPFPEDNILVIVSALIFCKVLANAHLEKSLIVKNLNKLRIEIATDAKEL